MARPPALDPLFRSLRSFKGVGPQLGALLNRYFGSDEHEAVALDLLMHMPVGSIDRRRMDGVAYTFVGHQATLKLHIDRHEPVPRNMPTRPHRVFAHDETGEIQLVFFRATGGWVEKLLPVGGERYIAGTIGFFQGMKQITHPDYVLEVDKFAAMPLVEPVYPLTQGLTSKALIKLVREVLATLPELPEWIAAERMEQFRWPSFHEAMSKMHAPEEPGDSELWSPARMRLAYDEYLAGQLALLIVRSTLISPRGIARSFTGEITGRVLQSLPFALTPGQQMAVDDIRADLAKPERMSRLLQGDVGAGKTVVALMAMAAVAESGAQSALMSPTELLAAQHYRTLQPLAEAAGLRVALLTGKQAAAERRAVLAGIADGSTHIVVGTHALFQSQVEFHNLGLTVVDEQHRFGVEQRLALSDKGRHADLLVMTATPIPRTLVLTHFGDMAVSVLREKPRGRQPIDTAVLSIGEYDRVIQRLQARIADGAQAFWVTPLVEESEELDVVSAEDRFKALQQVFGAEVALVHGRMSATAKQEAMARFQRNETKILVATTVIEVGVDVPNATIMIIEHAERFGLAQLHQLRGRVGRGTQRSACLLLYKEPLTDTARARLETIKSTEDGFEIAERDLDLRGQGDLLGTRQSGMPGYRLAVPDVHRHLLEYAHEDASNAFNGNRGLTGPQGEALRTLLYLFRKDLALPLLRAG
ncbi:MAG: ATP-dependent DNA helicase RecG [Devosia sp. 67-54]|uniref:ATP-dependent DNA helicase RecG n=1 Tax=unclassified Devosia TaxID=196773 RepID=UPI000959FCAD|nr:MULTISPECIES: ATP-dependent DNA helicase RecG [unclassified Devosia]MBN9304400.1 ATP-dependent DNA helicase RecG [Devosia sp.]OJX18201.1 MAG: ATP-dependent DNA helicase RecG [Devosia sp. 67-54]